MQTQPHEISGFRLSPQQQQLLSLEEPVGATQALVFLRAPWAEADLRRALETVVGRHEILRTTFVRSAGMRIPQQAIQEDLPPSVTALAVADDDALQEALAGEAAALDLERGPVLRAALVDVSDGRHALVLTAPAACLDAHSVVLLLAEIQRAHAGGTALGEEPLQHADYAEWRHQLLTGGEDRPQGARLFWSEGWSGRPPTLLFGKPVGGEAAALRRFRLAFAGELVAAVRAAAEASRVSEALFLEACWHALVARLSGESELTLAGVEPGRSQPDLEGAIGPYAQHVPIRSRHDEKTTFAEVLDQVRRSRSDAVRWQEYATAGELSAFAAGVAIGFGYADAALEGSLFAGGGLAELSTPLDPLALEL